MSKRELVHRGANHHRTEIDDPTGKLEKIAATVWENENLKNPGNLYRRLRRVPNPLGTLPSRTGEKDPPPVTPKEVMAAASIFQWMFTNIGRDTMERVYREAGWKITIEDPATIERKRASENQKDGYTVTEKKVGGEFVPSGVAKP